MQLDKLAALLKENEDSHFNFVQRDNYKVSTGSLKLDVKIGGGLASGIHRFMGVYEGGKEQPVSEPVLTPNGWVLIGELKKGDKVIGSDGKEQEVLAIYPQGKKKVYRVVFDDGSHTRCGLEHLWETSSFLERRKGARSVKSFKDIKNSLKYGALKNHSVRLVKPIHFSEKKFNIDPYVMGLLLGDANFSDKVYFTSQDSELFNVILKRLNNNIKFSGASWTVNDEISKTLVFKNQRDNPVIQELRKLKLLNKLSFEKFIPREYLYGSIEQRLDLLHGLIDSDGYLNKNKSEVIFYSTSSLLASNVVDIVRSLGGIARKRFKKSSYIDKYGERKHCKDCYIVTFWLPEEFKPCKLDRKLKNYSPRQINFHHFIKEIIDEGEEESVCIKVSGLDSLYVTNDYILTHNTSESLEVMKNFRDSVEKPRLLYIKSEGRLEDILKKRSGIKFTENIEEWEEGTCFVLKCNLYDFIIDFLSELINNNPNGEKICIIIDSLDALILKCDMDKRLGDFNTRVAGAPLVTKRFMQRMSLPITEYGHMVILISQVTSQITTQYDGQPIKKISGSGGNAANHFATFSFDFLDRNKKDLILENPNADYNEDTNKIIGHWAKLIIRKSSNESSQSIVTYPIKHGRTGGTSIWWEKELIDILLEWEILIKKGSWFSFEENSVAELKKVCDTCKVRNKQGDIEEIEPDKVKIQGLEKVFAFLTDNPKVSVYWKEYVKANCIDL